MTTTFKQVKNNAKTHVVPDGLNNVTSPVTFSVVNGQGLRFPATGNSYYTTIYDDSVYTDPFDDPQMEIGLVTVKTGDSFTMTRNQLGTSAKAHSGSPAMKILIVDQQIIDIQTAINTLETAVAALPANIVDMTSAQALTNKDLSSATNSFPFFLLTVSGIQNLYNKVYRGAVAVDMYDNGTVMGVRDIDWRNGDVQKVTVSGATTLRMANMMTGQRLTLQISESATGGYGITLSGTGALPFRYAGGTAPTYTTTANAVNLIVALYNGSVFLTQASVGFA